MTDTIKEKAFYEAQKYVATQEWVDIREELERDIEWLTDYILEDATREQTLDHSRNMMRGKGIEIVKAYQERIDNPHLQKILQFVIIDDNRSRLLIPAELSEDIVCFSEKDWARRKRMILRYIADFEKIYWQREEKDNNESVEAWLKPLDEGISL